MESTSIDLVARYREYVEFQLAIDGEGLGLREARQALANKGIESQETWTLDELAVEAVQTIDDLNPALLADAPDRPLTAWWWHLGKLRNGTYPAQLLPPHLWAVYQAASCEAA